MPGLPALTGRPYPAPARPNAATDIKQATRGIAILSSMKPETRSFYQHAVQLAIDHLVANLDEALELEALAGSASLSPFHFHRMFRGMVGETPLELLRRLRMERAAWSLTASTRPITDIAFEAGYETHEAFTRAFRTCYSASPSSFRSAGQPRFQLAAASGVHFTAGGSMQKFIPRDSGGQQMQVEITEMPELRVAAVRHVGPYNQISSAFERLGKIAGPAGLTEQPGVSMVAIFYDDPESTPQNELRSDAALVVGEGVPVPDGLTEQRIPAGRYACTVHVGPYEELGDAWARFMGEWLPAREFRMGPGVSYEVYRNDPTMVPKEELITEMYIPVA